MSFDRQKAIRLLEGQGWVRLPSLPLRYVKDFDNYRPMACFQPMDTGVDFFAEDGSWEFLGTFEELLEEVGDDSRYISLFL